MKLAIVGTRGIPAKYGGFETFAEQISTRLVESHVDVTVICPAGEGQDADYKGVKRRFVPHPALGPATTIYYDMRSLWKARKGYDVVYMLGYGTAFFCWLPRLFGAESWINMDGIEWRRSKWSPLAKAWLKAMEAIALHTATRIICDAAAVESDLASRHPSLPLSHCIAYGADIVRVPAEQVAATALDMDLEPDRYFLAVARIEPENHVLEIIEAHALAASPFPLVIVGNVPENSPYGRAIRTAAGRADVRLVGGIYDKHRLDALRSGALAYLHGHSVGGTNPALLEAMACGCVVVGHDNPFNREVLGPTAAGFFSDARALARHIESLVDRTATARHSIGEAARQRVEERYSWARIAGEYLKLLESVEAGR